MSKITSAAEPLGALLVVVGLGLIWPPIGVVAAGVALVLWSFLAGET